MKINRYLIVGKRRNSKPTARLTVTTPALESHEIAVKISLDIPEELFTKPQLEATIKVPEDSVNSPVIEAEVIDNIKEIVSKQQEILTAISWLSKAGVVTVSRAVGLLLRSFPTIKYRFIFTLLLLN